MLISSSADPVNDGASFQPALHCFLTFIPFVFIRSVTVFYQGGNIERGPLVGSGKKTEKGWKKKKRRARKANLIHE